MTKAYPPYTITSAALKLVAAISEQLALLSMSGADAPGGPLSPRFDIYSSPDVYSLQNVYGGGLSPQLRRKNRIRTIHASLAIENNTLSLEQVTDIIDGKPIIGPPRDIQEVRGAVAAYEKLDAWQPHSLQDLHAAP